VAGVVLSRPASYVPTLAERKRRMSEPKPMAVDLDSAWWFKSSYSSGNTDNCVEVAFIDALTAVRDSKHPQGPVLLFTAGEWDAFRNGVADGEFDRPAGR
jgi:hypothetical protein